MEEAIPEKAIWIPKVLRKVYFFTWLAAMGGDFDGGKSLKKKFVCISWCCL